MKITVSLLLCLVAFVDATCCQHRECNQATEYCNSQSGCTWNRSKRGECVPKKKDGEEVAKTLLSWEYDKCASGNGGCGYCSSTCKTDKGCRSVPERGMCTTTDDCVEGLFCDPGT